MSDELSGGMVISTIADYVHHDNYPSPIGIADLAGWQTTYGVRITGNSWDNNNGRMTAQVNIRRAGTYSLTTQVDGIDVIGSPFEFLEVYPTTLHAPSCVAKDTPTEIMAGFAYSF